LQSFGHARQANFLKHFQQFSITKAQASFIRPDTIMLADIHIQEPHGMYVPGTLMAKVPSIKRLDTLGVQLFMEINR
jgi:hypothetical protein